MYKVDTEIYFENRLEQVAYSSIKDFILSFYSTNREIKQLMNNIKYRKTPDSEKSYQNYKKEVLCILTMCQIEHPEFKSIFKGYKTNKSENVLSFVLQDTYEELMNRYRESKIA